MRIGISDKAVSKWERGVGLPDIGYLNKLAILLNTDAESLLSGNEMLQENAWQGILCIPVNADFYCDVIIYDKPLINYLLGYFLLLGIKRILINTTAKEIERIFALLGDGSKLGVELQYFEGTLYNAVYSGIVTSKNVMMVYGRTLIYGVDQTRFFKRAMVNRDGFSLMVTPKHGDQLTRVVYVDENKKIIAPSEIGINQRYDYCHIPFLFCPLSMFDVLLPDDSSETFVNRLFENKNGYAEVLDRGFVEISVNEWNDVNEASTFVRIVQDKCGMEIYCLEEIAWRRGMISLNQLKHFADELGPTKYGTYIKSLCERYERQGNIACELF